MLTSKTNAMLFVNYISKIILKLKEFFCGSSGGREAAIVTSVCVHVCVIFRFRYQSDTGPVKKR